MNVLGEVKVWPNLYDVSDVRFHIVVVAANLSSITFQAIVFMDPV